jgi:hypothetical protein
MKQLWVNYAIFKCHDDDRFGVCMCWDGHSAWNVVDHLLRIDDVEIYL